ncbi:dynamin family protein [Streptomyces griseus]|uniref:Dynamin family protein n=2 Tax=Streptomyces TaxID=1883 RepID=A0ABU2W9K6_9ACTN|nr:dynamin family protein [Streptomyces griseus]MDT0494173.1 dynamin family protein [Streptomyces griseus]
MNDTTGRTDRHDALVDLVYEAAEAVEALTGESASGGSAARILAELDALSTGAAVAVCVGEKKRGKSSLINALTGHPGLLPVDIDVASSVHVLVRHGETPQAAVHRWESAGAGQEAQDQDHEPTAEPVALDRIAEYAALDPETQLPRYDDVSHLDVAVPAEVLRPGLVLVDTPGVGGLVAGHAQLTLATLGRADALVFVTDGSGELTRSELAFLERATERIATVVFVLTKTDKYPHWRKVMERDRALIAEHAPRYARAPWFAVSAVLEEDAQEAERAGDPETARLRGAEGGCGELRSALRRLITDRALDLRMANTAHVIRGALAPLAAQADRMLEASAGDPAVTAEVQRLQSALAREKSAAAAWRTSLRSRAAELEADLLLRFRRSVNDLRSSAEDLLSVAGSATELQKLPASLEEATRAAWLDLENALGAGLGDIARETGAEIEKALGGGTTSGTTSGTTPGTISGAASPFGLPLPDRLRDLPQPVSTAHDQSGPGAFMERLVPSWGAGAITFGVGAFLSGGLFIPLVAGAGVTAWLSSRRRLRGELFRERADVQRYVSRVVNELNTEAPPLIRKAVGRTRDGLVRMITLALEQREREVRGELKELRAVLAREQEEREELADAARSRYELITGLLDRLDALAPMTDPAAFSVPAGLSGYGADASGPSGSSDSSSPSDASVNGAK